jgi:hypothetical protein
MSTAATGRNGSLVAAVGLAVAGARSRQYRPACTWSPRKRSDFPALARPDARADRIAQALPGVANGPSCNGCGESFARTSPDRPTNLADRCVRRRNPVRWCTWHALPFELVPVPPTYDDGRMPHVPHYIRLTELLIDAPSRVNGAGDQSRWSGPPEALAGAK